MSDHVCPTCGDTFDTRRGLGVHHSIVHDERLPNRSCSNSGKEFYSDSSKKFCSRDCVIESGAYAGKKNGNYQGGKVETTCEICETNFSYYPSEKEERFCRDCVRDEQWQDPPRLSGKDHPHWAGGKRTKQCEICGDTIRRRPGDFVGEVALCSRQCHHEWLSRTFTGEGHPNWEGGPTGPYGKGWAAVRRQALERADYACRVCGDTKAELGRNPDVHHIQPVRSFDESEAAHTLGNVISLCPDCHRKAECGKIPAEALGRRIA